MPDTTEAGEVASYAVPQNRTGSRSAGGHLAAQHRALARRHPGGGLHFDSNDVTDLDSGTVRVLRIGDR